MSDLGGGRASNGGARTGGPVPVSSAGGRAGMRTPTQIMRDRTAREAQRQEEQKAEEQRRLAEERRRSAERRAAAVGGAAPRFSQTSSQYSPDVSAPQSGFDQRRSGVGQVAPSDALGNPTSRASQQVYPDARTRGPSVTQQDQPRPAPATSAIPRRAQPNTRQPTSTSANAGPASAGPSQQPQADAGAQQRSGPASFPHAFQRWEDLSSHWEGLTSYWLRKLEQNTEEIHNIVPNAVTLNRQITDLSAAGANLFHAVVELQRLRASSERKFQRWFFESKASDERQREMYGQLQNQLEVERNSRDDAARQRAETSTQVETARREVAEMRRELMISKDEARRAWEELGRRNQESLDTAQKLKDGQIAIVHGVQVVPYFGGPSRTGSASQRPATRDGQPQYGSTGMASGPAAAGLSSPGDERDYYQQEVSPTNTDPFTEVKPLQQGPQSFNAGTYYPSTASPSQRPPPASAGSLTPSRPPATSAPVPISDQEAQRFYQHAPRETFLHSPPTSSQGVSAATGTAPYAREDVRSEASYVDTISEGDTEYALDSSGNVRTDDQGRPIVFAQPQRHESNETDDSYDVQADIRREAEHAARYGTGTIGGGSGAGLGGSGIVPPEAPTAPSTSAQAMAHFSPTTAATGTSGRPTYEGEEYEDWDRLQTRHHHPTRLSDVLEEEEERSSRQTRDT